MLILKSTIVSLILTASSPASNNRKMKERKERREGEQVDRERKAHRVRNKYKDA